MEKVKPLKIYPSSSAFARGRSVYTKFNSGCVRKILLNKHGIRETLKTDTRALGAANEEAYETRLQSNPGDLLRYEREKVLVSELDSTGTVVLSGRVDFVLYYPDLVKVVELKSTRSVNKRRDLRKGILTTENVAQLIAYMCELESTVGSLLYTFYDEAKLTQEDFEFAVIIEDNGGITINGAPFEFTVYDYLQHRELAVHTVVSDDIGPRPVNWNKPFDSPCHFCPFKTRCALFDENIISSVEQFCAADKTS